MSEPPAASAAVRSAALVRYLRTRLEIEGDGLYLPAGERETLLARLRSMGADGGAAADPRTVGRLASEGTAEEISALSDLETVEAVATRCVRCPLHETRKSVVFADGSPRARVMCVGEAPGANEDETGLPFVGRAGRLLDRLLMSVGFAREDVYICNVLKCRPPGNRNPEAEEIERCSPFLRRQVALVAPEVIITFGTFASRTLLGLNDTLGRMRGRTHRYEDVPLIATYHPAALLRNPNWTRPAWEDLQRVRRVLEGADHG
ncbi:MAG: uracil-DNA glycosylase [Gemmatimonadota bacterium]